MSYRGPQSAMNGRQAAQVRQYAGHTAIWHQYISATSGTANLGIGDTLHYRTQTITGVFGDGSLPKFMEQQGPAGMIAAGDVYAVTQQQLSRQDKINWRGVDYRVDSDPVRAIVGSQWVAILKRGD